MSLQLHLEALAQAVGADIKQLRESIPSAKPLFDQLDGVITDQLGAIVVDHTLVVGGGFGFSLLGGTIDGGNATTSYAGEPIFDFGSAA